MAFNKQVISRIAMVIVFLALIRIIGEFFRLDYTIKEELTIGQLYPYMAGAMLCACSCFMMTILSFYAKYKWITGTAVLTVMCLIFLKYLYIL